MSAAPQPDAEITMGDVTYRRVRDIWRLIGGAREPMVGPRMSALLDRVAELEATVQRSLTVAPLPTPAFTDEMVEAAVSMLYFEWHEHESTWPCCPEEKREEWRAIARSALEAALAASPVRSPEPVMVDEWRLQYANGNRAGLYSTRTEAVMLADHDNQSFPGCGARVMRTALVDDTPAWLAAADGQRGASTNV
jgi:hypothetical protein